MVLSGPKHPQPNWEAERAVKTFKSLLKEEAPFLALLAYRPTSLRNEYSPAELIMGCKVHTIVHNHDRLISFRGA